MTASQNNKRQYERIFFAPEDGVMGTFSYASTDVIAFATNIMDLSVGGLYFTLKHDKAKEIKIGASLTLKEINTSISLQIIAEINLKVVRIQDYDFIEHVGFGCEFTDLSDGERAKIKQLVEWGINSQKVAPTSL